MKLELLMSCMHQNDDSLVRASKITSDVVVINQCDREDYAEYPTEHGIARMFSTKQRGLTKSRNMAIAKSNADVCLLCDDDEVFQPDYHRQILNAYEAPALPKDHEGQLLADLLPQGISCGQGCGL